MKNKLDIVTDWLPRYTGTELKDFGEYILLTNFSNYVELFAKRFGVEISGQHSPMQTATANNITIINFGMGSPMAATVVDLLLAIKPTAILFLGKCGGLKENVKLGDLIIPIAAIRGEGTSDEYFDPSIPALPSFAFQRALSESIIKRKLDYWTGTVYTTNRRVWEHDAAFKEKLKHTRASAIDMETATIFIAAFANKIPHGALLLVSDSPMQPEGIKTSASDKIITQNFVEDHIGIGIEALMEIIETGESVKHLRFGDTWNGK